MFVTWWQLLRLTGEPVGPDDRPVSYLGDRYKRRVELLRKHGYFTHRTGTATAGGTVEIVAQQRGSRTRAPGLVVRATARWCATYQGGDRVRLPANRLLPGP